MKQQKTKKHIWIINQYAGKYDSGAAERSYFFAKYFAEKGYHTTIFSGSYNHLFIKQPEIKGTFTKEEVEPGIDFVWVKIPPYKGKSTVQRFYTQLLFAFRTAFIPLKNKTLPDYIISSSPSLFTSFSGWWIKRRAKAKKFIFEIRDLWPLSAVHLLHLSKYHPVVLFMDIFEWIGYKKSDEIVTLLPYAHKHIRKFNVPEEKVTWISNGIEEELIGREPLPAEIESMLPKDKFIIGYTGAMGIANALEFFVEAARYVKNPDIHFVLVGDGYEKSRLMEMAKASDNVTFIPKIKKTQVQSMLKKFDVCYIGRHDVDLFDYGVASNKYFDYMLAEKPVLVSSRKIKDPVELSGCGIIVEPENPKAIAEGVEEFYRMSPEERQAMGMKGYEYVKKYHNFYYLTDKYIRVFEK